MSRILRWGLPALVVLLIVIQLVPYGRNHANPPATQEPNWDNPHTRELTSQACFDCHSNETVWPWYSNVAPVSWLIQHDVEEGRARLNFSDWGRRREVDDVVRVVRRGKMPPTYYGLMHPSPQLSSSDQQALIQGLTATFGPGERAERGGHD